MEESDSHTDSLRAERGKRPEDAEEEATETPMSLGSMIRGPIGSEAGPEGGESSGSPGTEEDEREAREREG